MAAKVKSRKKINAARNRSVERKNDRGIDEHRRAEEALRESEERLRLCVATAHLGTYDWDLVNDRHVWSPETYEIYGLSRDTPLTLDLIKGMIYPGDQRDEIIAAEMDPVTSHGGYTLEYRIVRTSDGTVRWINTNTRVFFEGEGAERRPVRVLGVVQDITERKRAEEQLRNSEVHLAGAQKLAHLGSFEWDLVSGIDKWSDEMFDILGLRPGEVKPSLESYLNAIHPDDRKMVKNSIANSRSGGTIPHGYEVRIIKPDGTIRWISLHGQHKYDGSGRPVCMIGTMMDITDRKEAEEALRESERYLQSIFEGIQEGISILDKDMNILKANHAMKKWYFHMLPLEGKKCYEVYQGRTSTCDDCPSLRAMKEKSLQMSVVPYVNRSGHVGWMELYSSPLMDKRGDVIGVIEHVRDITQRKEVEEALRLTQFALDEFSDSAIWLSPEGSVVYVNETACSRLGYTREELLSMHIWDIDIDRDYRPDLFKVTWDLLKNQGTLKFESRHRTRTGQVFPVEVTVSNIRYGNKEYLISCDRDITERKKLMESLEKAKAQSELYLDLMGHDINNMHQIALGYLELARSAMPGAGRDEYLDKSIEVLQRSSLLIKNVRKLQKLNDGVLQIKDIDLCVVLSEIQREFGAVPLKTITLNTNGCDCCTVRANELLYDVFANLVSNAIKHTGNEAHIEIGLEIVVNNNREHYRVSVADDGPGISDDFKDKIFNRMSRGASPAKGMGLGLYVVKSLVNSYGGHVWVEDRVAGDHTKGARLVVLLPAVEC